MASEMTKLRNENENNARFLLANCLSYDMSICKEFPFYALKEAVQLSDKLPLFNSKFYHEFDGVNIFCQKLTLLAWGAF